MNQWQQQLQREKMGWAWQKKQEELAPEQEDFGRHRSYTWVANLIWLIIVGGLLAFCFGALK